MVLSGKKVITFINRTLDLKDAVSVSRMLAESRASSSEHLESLRVAFSSGIKDVDTNQECIGGFSAADFQPVRWKLLQGRDLLTNVHQGKGSLELETARQSEMSLWPRQIYATTIRGQKGQSRQVA
ncbi:hypothetical protein FBULB1_8460 [Fusarium bulbicola]|nr:hypothetical protein FBULB1_8460 [Fusarium bulbicola]